MGKRLRLITFNKSLIKSAKLLYSVLVIQASLSQLVSLSFVIVLGVHVPTFSTIVTHITIVMQFFFSHTISGFSLFLPMLDNFIAIPARGKDKKRTAAPCPQVYL